MGNSVKITAKVVAISVVALGVFVYKLDVLPSFNNVVSSSASTPGQSPEDEAQQAKMEPFIQCINGVDSIWGERYQIYRGMYADFVRGGPTPNLRARFYLTMHGDRYQGAKTCIAGLEKGIKATPADPELDKAGEAYLQTLRELLPLITELDTYYDQQSYRDDNKARGKALDEQIGSLFERLFSASSQMHKIISGRNLDMQRKMLAAMEKENGKDIWWQTENVMLQARVAVDAIEALSTSGKMSAESVQVVETAYTKAYEEAKAYGEANRPAAGTAKTAADPFWFDIASTADSLALSIKTLRRDQGDGKKNVSRDLDDITRSFNRLVERYNERNQMRQRYIASTGR
ncbi:hypothetical protein DAI18_11985 [Microvirgula aerodenitrificans]|uniref:DUF3829 domain-containing protein n=1 Tax=Microvirgula aerodenitrificans TaxID=57480 RepID=A0A2S0PBB4_9NEIS|nr:hypothetical protein DAI18_11985 [Microvirgula aerodenitrificans]